MADGIKFDTSGIDALNDRLQAAARKMESLQGSRAAAQAIRNALNPVVKDAQARVNSISGNLAGAIRASVKLSPDSPTMAEVGVKYAGYKHNGRHAHLVEGGHGGPHGPAKANPFWQPAIDGTYTEMVRQLEQAVADAYDEIMGG